VERRVSMKRHVLTFLLLLWYVPGYLAHAERTVVLVTNSACTVDSMTMLEVRKAYFGLTISEDKRAVRAFRLKHDDDLTRIFFQTVVAMSESSYERRLRSMLLQHGIPRPREFYDVRELLGAVQNSDCAIAYVWGDDATGVEGIKELRLLWQGE
jgi:hypothetical protein